MSTAIQVESLGKSYRLGEGGRQGRYRTVRECLVECAGRRLPPDA